MILSENTTNKYIVSIELAMLLSLVDYIAYAFKENLLKLSVIL